MENKRTQREKLKTKRVTMKKNIGEQGNKNKN